MDLAAAQDVPVEDRAGRREAAISDRQRLSSWTGMPRYAIEHLDKEQRAHYMSMKGQSDLIRRVRNLSADSTVKTGRRVAERIETRCLPLGVSG
jgi:hypothetical protein